MEFIQYLPRACKLRGIEVGRTGFFVFNNFSESIEILIKQFNDNNLN